MNPDALLCSNTSTLPITELADGVSRPEDFIGMHFFSPVDKMPLVELIRGEKTSDETIARAIDVVQQIKKTPIVVNDSRGFYTSRVYGTLLTEAAGAARGGRRPADHRAGRHHGRLPGAAAGDARRGLADAAPRRSARPPSRPPRRDGIELPEQPGTAVIERMVDEFGRKGKAAGAGFYDYPADARKHLWSGLREHFAGPAWTSRWSTSRSATCSGWRWRPPAASTRA